MIASIIFLIIFWNIIALIGFILAYIVDNIPYNPYLPEIPLIFGIIIIIFATSCNFLNCIN